MSLLALNDILRRHRQGEAVGVTSVCSAHKLVIEAALLHAARHAAPVVLIEATSNQVNQEGGYSGMTPAQFRASVEAIAAQAGIGTANLVLGGDHLGPNAWSALPAEAAMARATVMVGDYVRAGFRKIHLDCSMRCADDPALLPETRVAERAAVLCQAAEAACADAREADRPIYVIGTEVPVPGGAAETLDALAVTAPEAALATIETHRAVFARAGLQRAWPRVVASVVQPGVEFDHEKAIDYVPEAAADLCNAIGPVDGMVFEAHSTDHQTKASLSALVRGHFAILKVGPALTFALRAALWGLDAIERECVAPDTRAGLRDVVLGRMRAAPGHWQRYYHATGDALTLQLQYSLSDRIRYYWPDPAIVQAEARLFDNLRAARPPLPLIAQYLPGAAAALRARHERADPLALVLAAIGAVLDDYHGACHPHA